MPTLSRGKSRCQLSGFHPKCRRTEILSSLDDIAQVHSHLFYRPRPHAET